MTTTPEYNTPLRVDSLVRPHARYFRLIQPGQVGQIHLVLLSCSHTSGPDTPSPSLLRNVNCWRTDHCSYWSTMEGIYVGTTTLRTRALHPSEPPRRNHGATERKRSGASRASQTEAWKGQIRSSTLRPGSEHVYTICCMTFDSITTRVCGDYLLETF